MRRLISLALASLPFTSPIWADTPTDGPLSRRALVARSYGTDFTHRILNRSTGAPVPETGSRTQPERSPTVVLPGVEPESKPAPKKPATRNDQLADVPATSPLSRRILARIALYDDIIERYSRINEVDANLVRAIIYVESAGDPGAESHKGARGLMQLMPGTASDMGVINPGDPAQNIYGGTRYLAAMLDRFQRVDLALWGYNAGPETVERRRIPLETKRYIPEVLRIKNLMDEREGA